MSTTTLEQNNWVTRVLGFDIDAVLARQDQGKAPDPSPDPSGAPSEASVQDQAKGGFFDFIKQKVGETVGSRPPLPKDKDLAKALEDLDDQIAAVQALGFETKRLEEDRWDCAWSGDKAEKLTGDARGKALTGVKARIANVMSHAKSLADSSKSVMGDSKDPPTKAQKSAIYKKALEDHYGITIENTAGTPNTHLDRVFDMFGTVPLADANQDKLKKLLYLSTISAGGGAYNSSELAIKMGDFGDASASEAYEIDGKVLDANSFDVTTLHEIGHAVDAKHGIMTNSSNYTKAGCGGWDVESVDKITIVYLAEMKKTAGLSKGVDEAALTTAISAALSSGSTAKPDAIAQADWVKALKFLTEKCLAIRAANSPWFKNQVIVGGRVYQEAYGGRWYSYSSAARESTKVNKYQWRAPGEWFAEVYAITWLKKMKPPSAIDAAVAQFMWNG
jgi:hypothetical protein